MPKPEPKPVVTLDEEKSWLSLDGLEVGWLVYEMPPAFHADDALTAAELRAIADWLDQWEGATLLSEVTE